jgi:methionyl-tRNA formyltransferase
MTEWPGAFIHVNDEPLKVLRAHAQRDLTATPGQVIEVDDQPAIGASEGVLVLDEVQPAGRKPMAAASFLNGHPTFVGQRL